MNLHRLSWKNITFKPLSTLLSIILFALGVGLIALLLLISKQLQDNFDNNLAGVNLVIGAKGSPLQLILSSMYHIDAPTGNVSLKEVRPFLNPKHPLIADAVPLSMGDNYRNYRIVGTTPNIMAWYGATIAKGKVWGNNFEVTLGAKAAKDLGLGIGGEFKSSHGTATDEGMDMEHEDAFKVVGILKPTGTVIDQLILTTPQSFWLVHDHDDEEGSEEEEIQDEHDHEGHDHDDHEEHNHEEKHHHDEHSAPISLMEEDGEKEITSVLVKFKGHNFQALNMQRNINENTDLQAATPAIEINRLFQLVSSGEQVLRYLAAAIIFVSALSIFIALYSSLRGRRYELALMRAMGSSQDDLMDLIFMEGLILATIGCFTGLFLAHFGMYLIALNMEDTYRYSFSAWEFLTVEGLLVLGALIIGLVAALLPAVQASKTDIAETLSEG